MVRFSWRVPGSCLQKSWWVVSSGWVNSETLNIWLPNRFAVNPRFGLSNSCNSNHLARSLRHSGYKHKIPLSQSLKVFPLYPQNWTPLYSSNEAPVYKQTRRKEKNVLTRRTTVPMWMNTSQLLKNWYPDQEKSRPQAKKKQINRQKQTVSRCFGEEKGKAGKRESGVNLGGGGIAAALYFWTLSQHIPPKWGRASGVSPYICFTVFLK